MNDQVAVAVTVTDSAPGVYASFLLEKGIKLKSLGNNNSGTEMLALEPGDLVQACKDLKRQKGLVRLNFLTAVEVKEGYQSILYIDDIKGGNSLVIKVTCAKSSPKIPSLCEVYPTANWQEREAYDMLGIIFEGHPNLTRILNPDQWEGYPLRKDYIGPIDALNEPIRFKH
jgi:NADH:ubiquinone oxidoreductase subunit C